MKRPLNSLAVFLFATAACWPFVSLSGQEILVKDDFSTYAIGSPATIPGDGNSHDRAVHGHTLQEGENPDTPPGLIAVEETVDAVGDWGPSLRIVQKPPFTNNRRDIGFSRDFEGVSAEKVNISFHVRINQTLGTPSGD